MRSEVSLALSFLQLITKSRSSVDVDRSVSAGVNLLSKTDAMRARHPVAASCPNMSGPCKA